MYMSTLPEKLRYIIGILSTGWKTSDSQSINQTAPEGQCHRIAKGDYWIKGVCIFCEDNWFYSNDLIHMLWYPESIKHNLDIGYRVRCQGNDLWTWLCWMRSKYDFNTMEAQ